MAIYIYITNMESRWMINTATIWRGQTGILYGMVYDMVHGIVLHRLACGMVWNIDVELRAKLLAA